MRPPPSLRVCAAPHPAASPYDADAGAVMQMREVLGAHWDAPAMRWLLRVQSQGDVNIAINTALGFGSAADMRMTLGDPCAA